MITFGTDPEFLLVAEDGSPRNALSHLTATKEHPVRIGSGTIYTDNVLVELTIPPVKDAHGLREELRDVLQRAAKIVHPFRLRPQASATFSTEELSHPGSYRFGCNPEFDAWNLVNGDPTMITPQASPTERLRSCGGHIHVGIVLDPEEILPFVRVMDLYVGIPSVFLNTDPTNAERHRLYGGAGKFRVTQYGIEYRTLSNFWLASPQLAVLMFLLTHTAMVHATEYVSADVPIAINEHDRERAHWIYRQHLAPKLGGRIASMISKTATTQDMYEAWEL